LLKRAAFAQGVFALPVTCLFVLMLLRSYADFGVLGKHAAAYHWLFWLAGPAALVAAFPLARGSRAALRFSRWLTLTYPVGPLAYLKAGEMGHGVPVLMLAMAVLGLFVAVGMWASLRDRRLSLNE
jgi:hypothetical protein